MTFVCWPDTQHPSIDPGTAANIRSAMTREQTAIRWHDDLAADTTPDNTELFGIRQAAGAAPYVGRPFCYAWKVAVGKEDRWVAGSTSIEYPPEEWPSGP